MTENSNHASGSCFFACHNGERSDQTRVQRLAASLQKLKEATSALLNVSENVDLNPNQELTAYRQALGDAEAHVDGISVYLSGQIETGLHETIHALGREVEDVIAGYYARPWVYQLSNEITAPARKALDYFSLIYTKLSESRFKPDNDLFKNSTVTKRHVDKPRNSGSIWGVCTAEPAWQEWRQAVRAEWVRNWAKLQGEFKQAKSAGRAFDVLRVLARSIEEWAGELESAVHDFLRCDDDSVSRRRIICDRYPRDDNYNYDDDYPLFLTVPFVGVRDALLMLEFEHECDMAGKLDKRLREIDRERESLCEKVVAEVQRWDDNIVLHLFPEVDYYSPWLQGMAEACAKDIALFADVRQPKSNHEGMGSPSRNSAAATEQPGENRRPDRTPVAIKSTGVTKAKRKTTKTKPRDPKALTDKQKEAVDARILCGSDTKAGEKLGVDRTTVRQHVKEAEKKQPGILQKIKETDAEMRRAKKTQGLPHDKRGQLGIGADDPELEKLRNS